MPVASTALRRGASLLSGKNLAVRLFVYGTLMQGEDNAAAIAGGRLLGSARTRAAYTLVHLGAYPALLAKGDAAIAGELYEIDEPLLERLDELEEHPHLFRRGPVLLADGSEAQAYFLARASGEAPIVARGDWRLR